ncbi:MAG: mechanosensitive ion channel domain-containing protein [Candidatus Firestonebacteria bacterium]
MDKFLKIASEYASKYGPNLLFAVVIIVVGLWFARVISKIAGAAMVKTKVNEMLVSFTKTLIYYAMVVFVLIAALSKLGVETTSFIALIGGAGFAVGLAFHGILANFAAGVMLILFQPFKVGDYIDVGGSTGTIKEIQIFSTIIITKDQDTVIMPNSKIIGDKIVIHPK